MKLAVTDACIFIEQCEVELAALFFKMPVEVHTSFDVFLDIQPDHQQILQAFQSVGKLTIHNISASDRLTILNERYPPAFSGPAKTGLHLARKLDAMVLSTDGLVRNFAKGWRTDCHGVLWVLDRLIESGEIHPKDASKRLTDLVTANSMYRCCDGLAEEVARRMKAWDTVKK